MRKEPTVWKSFLVKECYVWKYFVTWHRALMVIIKARARMNEFMSSPLHEKLMSPES